MRFWQAIAMTDIDQLPTLAKRAEELGFEGVTLGDHPVTFATQYESYPYSADGRVLWYPETHWPDPWVQVAALSQVTTTLKFMSSVYVLPIRDPFSAAKAISTAARISNDRIMLGVGVGWQESEFDLVGQSFRNRGGRTDEMLTVMELLMSGQVVEFHGEFYDFEPLQMSPGVNKRVAVLIGGFSSAAYKRAARNDGWIGAEHDIEELPPMVATLKQERAALGKTAADPFDIIVALKQPTPENFHRAEDIGVTRILRNAWLDENGRASVMTLAQKLADMEKFAERHLA
ncbi:MAG TPA: TIGR03619 family F420-dependent LLM class oxidoreductase [Spongiibacteraceae bacterium]